jgi:Zn-dependent peptidase ImmA (M78 family)
MLSGNFYLEEKTERLLNDSNAFSIPVNLNKCIEYLNIQINSLELDEDVSGFLLLKEKKVHIGYNKSNSRQRQRFTIAHEIAHYILHVKNSKLFVDKTQKVLYRDLKSSTGEILQEREANAFAASLLMPQKLLIQELKKQKSESSKSFVLKLAKKFDVSEQAITIRLTNLGLIDYSELAS